MTTSQFRIGRFLEDSKGEYFVLAIITIMAAGLRFYKLGEWSFWLDEVLAIEQNMAVNRVLKFLIEPVITWWGVNEWTSRLVPCIIGVLTVPILYFPFKKLLDKEISFCAVLFLALSPWHIELSQNVRPYTLMFLCSALSMFFFYWGLEKDKLRYILLAAILTFISITVHYASILLLVVFSGYTISFLIFPITRPPGYKLKNLLFFVLPFIALGFPTLQRIASFTEWYWLHWSWENARLNMLIFGPLQMCIEVGVPLMVLALVGAVVLIVKKCRLGVYLAVLTFLPISLFVLISFYVPTYPRYVLIALSGVILLAAYVCVQAFRELESVNRFMGVGILLIVLSTSLKANYYYFKVDHGNRSRWKEAFQYVDANSMRDDIMIASNYRIFVQFYSDLDYENIYTTYELKDKGSESIRELEKKRSRIWIVTNLRINSSDPGNVLRDWIREKCRLVKEFETGAVNYWNESRSVRIYLFSPN